MEFLLFIGLVYVAYAHSALRERVDKLEKNIFENKRPLPAATFNQEGAQPEKGQSEVSRSEEGNEYTASLPASPVSFVPPQTPTTTIPLAAKHYQEEATEFFLYTWFREQTLIKIGSLIFFLGAVLFVSYAMEQNWISPLMRIVLGLLLASAVYVVGQWRKTTESTQYQVLTTLGTGIFLGTIVASQFAFTTPVLSPALAFILMLGSIGYTLFVAFLTKTEWLGTVAGVAGLYAPLLVQFSDLHHGLLLTYLFLLSVGFLLVVFFKTWRVVSLTMLSGVTLYLSILYNSTIDTTLLWFFVVLFSALFCASTAISVARTNSPNLYDVTALSVVTLQFILYAKEIALLPSLAFFSAAAATAFIGYSLRLRQASADAVSLFVAVSLLCILIGTAELFDGYILTTVYALEVLSLYLLGMRVATVPRSIIIAAALFIIPLVFGIKDLAALLPRGGLAQVETIGVFSVLATLGFSIVWTLRAPALQATDWLRQTAGMLAFAWYGFAMMACFVFGRAQKILDESSVIVILLSLVSAIVILYVGMYVRNTNWRIISILALLAPLFVTLTLLTHPSWSDGISHLPFLVSALFFGGLASVAVYYWFLARGQGQDSPLAVASYVLVWVVLGYGFVFLSVVWDSLFAGEVKRVVTMVSYVMLVYVLVSVLMLARVSVGRIVTLLVALVVPGLLLVESLPFSGWSEGMMSIDAVGVYVVTTIIFLLGTSLLQHKEMTERVEEKSLLQSTATTLYIVAGFLAFVLVWIMSQTVFASEAVAVTIALFVYTVVGLIAYIYGRNYQQKTWKRVGVFLLSAVVLRLGLVDVWGMELVWKIVTFLGIGLLFILAALLEKKPVESEVSLGREG
jgi:uncharacterized membrane protein